MPIAYNPYLPVIINDLHVIPSEPAWSTYIFVDFPRDIYLMNFVFLKRIILINLDEKYVDK